MKKIILFILITNLYLIADQRGILKDVMIPSEIVADKNNFYILDEFSILIFKRNSLELVKKIGRKGEGPGEFKTPPLNLSKYNNKLFIYSSGKVCLFSLNGDYINEKKIPIRAMALYPFQDKYIAKKVEFPKTTNDTLKEVISLHDKNLKLIINIGINESVNPMNEVNPIEYLSKIEVLGNKIFYGSGKDGFQIKVFNDIGKKLYIIKLENRNITIPNKEKEKKMAEIKKTPYWNMVKNKIKFPDYYPEIEDFLINDNKIFVKTHKKKSNLKEFYVFGLNGENKKKILLPNRKVYTIFMDEYIFLELNQNDEYEIVIKKWK